MLAPIVLFVYSRHDHTAKTIEALAANYLASESDLIIYADASKSDKEKGRVDKVRSYIRTITGFKSLSIRERVDNYGLSKSILEGVTEVVNQHGKLIVLEDDLVTSKYFLKYMNDALDKFEREDKVISINGYMFPVEETLPNLFFWKCADCWGWATWKRGWDLFETNGQSLLERIKEKDEAKLFDFNNSYPYIRMLEDQIAGRNNSWAILWYASAFVNDKLGLYPGKSLTYNVGNDNSGTHSISTRVFDVELEEIEVKVNEWIPVFEDNHYARDAAARYFRKTYSKFRYLRDVIDKYFTK